MGTLAASWSKPRYKFERHVTHSRVVGVLSSFLFFAACRDRSAAAEDGREWTRIERQHSGRQTGCCCWSKVRLDYWCLGSLKEVMLNWWIEIRNHVLCCCRFDVCSTFSGWWSSCDCRGWLARQESGKPSSSSSCLLLSPPSPRSPCPPFARTAKCAEVISQYRLATVLQPDPLLIRFSPMEAMINSAVNFIL